MPIWENFFVHNGPYKNHFNNLLFPFFYRLIWIEAFQQNNLIGLHHNWISRRMNSIRLVWNISIPTLEILIEVLIPAFKTEILKSGQRKLKKRKDATNNLQQVTHKQTNKQTRNYQLLRVFETRSLSNRTRRWIIMPSRFASLISWELIYTSNFVGLAQKRNSLQNNYHVSMEI